MEVKPEHKHRLRTDHKHRSRDDYKGKNKSERRPKKSGSHKKKERAMVADASDIDSSSCYSSSRSSDEEENQHKGKWSSKNINGLCFAAQGFCGMAHNSASSSESQHGEHRYHIGYLSYANFTTHMISHRVSLMEVISSSS
jgi:hypothetical protein